MLPAVQPLSKRLHAHPGCHHLLKLVCQCPAIGCTQQRMQGRPILSVVDVRAPEQIDDALLYPGFISQFKQCVARTRVEQVFGVIQLQPCSLYPEAVCAVTMPRKKLFNRRRSERCRMGFYLRKGGKFR